ncbi:MAG TPA: hypothetical protein VNW29_08075 [Candidatus Sulfotelmatobacter sp.]|jgi:hypothetical protein|nr:hypothetical protein [Candidatus Sulfotelmatobacter sp.]
MSEQKIDHTKIGLAVITSYQKWYSGKLRSIKHTDKVRGDLALEFAQKATQAGYHLVIADKGSSKTFLKELLSKSTVQLIKRKTKGTGKGKRLAIDKVSKIPIVEVIILIEAEKTSFLIDCLEAVVEPIFQGKADIVVPARVASLFEKTYPQYMYDSEIEGNGVYNEALRTNNIMTKTMPAFDWLFGPRAFRNDKEIVALFKKIYTFKGISLLEKLYTPDEFSNVQYFSVINALRKKLRVIGVEVPFKYPGLQKENEEIGAKEIFIQKRKLQRVGLLIDLMHFLSFLDKKKGSDIQINK